MPAAFYRTATGNEPVRAWLSELSDSDRRIIGRDIMDVEYHWPKGPIRARDRGVWEIRSNVMNGIARVLLFVYDGQMVVLHPFIKKTQRTPRSDLQLAIKRMKEVRGATP